MYFIFDHVIFFLVGLFQDLLITYYYQVVAKEQALSAAVTSMIVTVVNMLVLVDVLGRLDSQGYSIIAVYALGNGVGTFIVIKRHDLRAYFRKKN